MDGQIADDSENHSAPCNRFNSGRNCFSHGIDSIGSHGISTIHEDVNNYHRAGLGIDDSDLKVSATSAELDQNRVDFVAGGNQVISCLQDGTFCRKSILTADDLNLSNHNRVRIVGDKTPLCMASLGHIAGGCHH